MSYLSTPRLCFVGEFRAAGPTKNNLLAALDATSVLNQNPPWDFKPLSNGDFTLTDCHVSAAWDAQGTLIVDQCDDAVIGVDVLGTGKMADLDPEHRRVTDLVGMVVTVRLPVVVPDEPPPSLSGRMKITQLRDYWSDQSAVTAWQSVIRAPLWSGTIERSDVLKELRDSSPDGLSIRLTPIALPNRGVRGVLMGVIGPWSRSEPKQFVAARRLTTRRPAGQLPFPVATCLVDSRRKKLVADLSNMPMVTYKPRSDPLITELVASILATDDEGGGVLTTLGPSLDLTAARWLQTAGIVEWDLNSDQLVLLQDHCLRFTFKLEQKNLLMEENRLGYIDVDRRSLRLDPGGSRTVDIYATRFGQPLAGQVVNFFLEQQKAIAAVESILRDPAIFGYPTDPNRLINSEPREVLFDRPGPLQVVTDQGGHGRLTITARPGPINLPAARKTIDSQLYFLGEPDGWQSWGAIGPNTGDLTSSRVGAGCALVVLVFNTHPSPQNTPTWDDIKPWLTQYALLYPAMIGQPTINLDLSDQNQVDRDAFEIYRRLKCIHFEDVEHMPVTRDLSQFRRKTILAYLASVIRGPVPC